MLTRLKSLELQGFKTFASQVQFSFAGSVTAIVGPNGSGKSNIADAIRWVLGEQSFALLRAKKTEDMIFAGSEHRPRAGMAAATIIFDNSDGWLPIDFSEVAISRRAYRDGQNEYLINGQKVRLKDVSELLAQSGLAERNYTIIGQGLVDAALSLKAEERRRLFEEAAGIGLHRSRREESLRRLETTRRNLERVEDILAELTPRLRSLERQARRTIEYEQVKADLNLLLRDWYGYHWHRAQRDLVDAQILAARQEGLLDTARQAQQAVDAQLATQRGQIQTQREAVNGLHRQLADLHSRRERLNRDLVIADERMRVLTDQMQALQEELRREQEENGLYLQRLESAQAEVVQLQTDLNEARSQTEQARQALQKRQVARQRAEQALQEARQSQGALNSKQAQVSARLAERKNQAGRRQEQLQQLQAAVQTAEKELAAAEQRAKTAAARQAEAETARQQAERALQQHAARRSELEAQRRQRQDARARIQAGLARLQAQTEVLEQAEKNLVGYSEGARLLLQAYRRQQLKGSAAPFAHSLQAASEYETALAAALGEYLDAVILPQAGQVDGALDLMSNSAARSLLLPLDQLALPGKAGGAAPAPSELPEGILGRAAELARPTPEFAAAVELLLGRVWIARDRQAARQALPVLAQLAGENLRVVTLKGEVFALNGTVAVGGQGKGGALSRQRELRQLQEQAEAAQVELTQAEHALAEIEAALKQFEADEQALRRNVQQAAEVEKKVVAARGQEDAAFEQARRTARWNQEQHRRLTDEAVQAEKETAQLNAEVQKLETELGQARELVRQRSSELGALSLDEAQNQVSHWNTRQAVAQQALADAQKRRQERQAALERSQRNQQALSERLGELERQIEQARQTKGSAAEQEQDLNAKIEALMAEVRPAEALLQAQEKEHETLQSRDAETRQSLSSAEHNHAQARILLARRQEALEGLRRRVEDDFGLVAFKYAEAISGPTPLPLEGLVEQLPVVPEIPNDLEENIKRQRAQLRRMGPVNPDVQTEYQEVKERNDFLKAQVADLKQAEEDVKQVIAELDVLMQRAFRKTFDAVAHEFRQIFTRLFNGGSARLVLTSPDDVNETGVDIEARLPGRREQGLALLSGGERSLTASALVFALLKVSPTPFCLLDEVDAMLDEANVGRFRDQVRDLSNLTQFVVVTHNRNTVQAADVIYGVTMGSDSTSQVISLKLDQVEEITGRS